MSQLVIWLHVLGTRCCMHFYPLHACYVFCQRDVRWISLLCTFRITVPTLYSQTPSTHIIPLEGGKFNVVFLICLMAISLSVFVCCRLIRIKGNAFEIMWREVIVAWFKVLSHRLQGGTKKNQEKTWVIAAGLRAEAGSMNRDVWWDQHRRTQNKGKIKVLHTPAFTSQCRTRQD